MKKIDFRAFFLFALLFVSAIAQVRAQQSLTLQECIKYALEHQVSVQNAQLDMRGANARVGEVRSVGLPQINGNVQLVDNFRLRRIFVAGGNPFFETGLPPGQVAGIENPLQLRSTGDAGATISQLLFDGSYFVGLQAASVYKELSQKSYQQSKIQTTEAVTKAYYLVLINEERTSLLDNNLARLDTLLRQTRGLYEQGFAENIDVARIEVNYNNLLVEKQKFTNMKELSVLMLKFQMGMPMSEELALAQTLNDFQEEFTLDESQEIDFNKRVEYSMLQTNRKLNQLDLKNIRVQSLPNLSAFATGGFFTQHTSFVNLFSNRWYPYGLYGLQLNVPIFDGLGRVYRSQQAQVNIQKTENEIRNLENTIDFQVRQSQINHQNSVKTLEAQRRNLELAEEVTRISKIKYQEGVGSNLEVTTAEDSFREAQTNYFNALFDVLVATVDYKIALGTLSE